MTNAIVGGFYMGWGMLGTCLMAALSMVPEVEWAYLIAMAPVSITSCMLGLFYIGKK